MVHSNIPVMLSHSVLFDHVIFGRNIFCSENINILNERYAALLLDTLFASLCLKWNEKLSSFWQCVSSRWNHQEIYWKYGNLVNGSFYLSVKLISVSFFFTFLPVKLHKHFSSFLIKLIITLLNSFPRLLFNFFDGAKLGSLKLFNVQLRQIRNYWWLLTNH